MGNNGGLYKNFALYDAVQPLIYNFAFTEKSTGQLMPPSLREGDRRKTVEGARWTLDFQFQKFFQNPEKSTGQYRFVCAIIDERYELSASFNGKPTLDVGINNFVISGCPKHYAIELVVRSMSPDVIVVDELCTSMDFESVK